jgi:hypothetical protein
MTITDTDGNTITYWPISGLLEGENSEVLTFNAGLGAAVAGTSLIANPDIAGKVKVWAKRSVDVSYIDISSVPYDLSTVSGNTAFNCYVEALTTIVGLERIPIAVFVGVSLPALWRG